MEDTHIAARILHLPSFHSICRWKASCNPHYNKVCAESRQWVLSYNILSPGKWDMLDKCLPELLCSWAYPYATPEQLRLCCDFTSLLFVVDEISDDQSGNGAAATGYTLLDALRDGSFDDGSKLCKMTQDFRSRFLPTTSKETYNRFVRNMDYYIKSFTIEADLREKDVVLGMNSYTLIRRGNSGCLPSFDMMGIELPDAVFDNSIFRAIYDDATDLVTIPNDVYSYDKEQSSGHYAANIVSVLQRERGLTIQQAVECAAEQFKLCMERFESNIQLLPSFGAEADAAVDRYIMTLKLWVAGNLEWSFESLRYFGERGPSVKQSLIVELSPLLRSHTDTS